MKKIILLFVFTFAFYSISVFAQTKEELKIQTEKEANAHNEKALGDHMFEVNGGTEVSGEGYAIFGNPSAGHIAIDTDDIQRKFGTGASYSTLYMNWYGGSINLNRGLDGNPSDCTIGASTNDGQLNAYSVLYVNGATNAVSIGSNDAALGYELSVDGEIACEELLIDASASWPDYVFEDDYNLRTIDELAQSIEDNGHLPGIPSAEVVEEEGFLVADMQRRTMEKVEELSLYIIQLHERVKALEAENEALKAKK